MLTFVKTDLQTMRKKGSTFSMTRERDEDLMRAYHLNMGQAMKAEGEINKMDVIHNTVNSPASRYWVSLERACDVVYQMKKGQPFTVKKHNSRRLYESIYNRYVERSIENPDIPIKHLVAEIIEEPAPCFALTPQSASLLINRIQKKQWYIERRRLLRHLF